MKICHVLSDYVFLRQSTKLSAISNSIRWQIHQDEETDPYIPTVICFPFNDFKLIMTLTSISTGLKTIYKSYVNLSNYIILYNFIGKLKYN